MKIFITGASGFVGSAVTDELIRANHQVVGLARSEASAEKIKAAGAQVHLGSIEDLDSLKSGAEASDGVIHCGFIHDFNNFAESIEKDRAAIETLGSALEGSARPMLVTSGLALLSQGKVATEEDLPSPHFPRLSEKTSDELVERGIYSSTVRLSPSVHGEGDHGFIPIIIAIAREKGISAYIEDGQNKWPGVHRLDAAVLYRLAIEKGAKGARFHGVGDSGVTTKEIAEIIGKQLNLPVVSKTLEESGEHFGWMANFFGMDLSASSFKTQEELGWKPSHVSLIEDLSLPHYFAQ